jgi:hypothetical protein
MDIVIHTDEATIIAKEIHSLTFFHRTEKKSLGKKTVAKGWFGSQQEEKFEEVSMYDLRMIYKDMNGKMAEYSATSQGRDRLKNQFKDMQRQIKQQDATLVDRAFEEQVLK